MAKITAKYLIAPNTHYIRVDAPLVSRHAKPGQFVIIRVSERGERIPLTIADVDPMDGAVIIVVQEVGKTTQEIGKLKEGDDIRDFLGPLGTPSEMEKFGAVVLLGGGFGIAAIHYIAKGLRQEGNTIYSIIGARNKDLLVMQDQMRLVSDYLTVMTDDGSAGNKGLVTEPLKELLKEKDFVKRVIAVGPLPMMRAVSEVTRQYGIKTMVSLNPIMVDGTGMCGGCRVTVDHHTFFACTDGPEFDGHLVDFDELVNRTRIYKDCERAAIGACLMNHGQSNGNANQKVEMV